MNRRRIEKLLQRLPDSSLDVLDEADELEEDGFLLSAHLVRAMTHGAVDDHERCQKSLDAAAEDGLSAASKKEWRDHIFDGDRRPLLPCFDASDHGQRPKTNPLGHGFGEAEPTQLIGFDEETHPEEHSPDTGDTNDTADDETHLIFFDDDEVGGEDEVEPTRLLNLEFDEETTNRRFVITDPTLPGACDRAIELPRYESTNAKVDDAARSDKPTKMPGLHEGPAASFGFDDGEFEFDSSTDGQLELDDRPIDSEPPQEQTKSAADDTAYDTDDSRPQIEPKSATSPSDDSHLVRQFTVVARARIEETLNSPARALILASITAMLVFGAGLSIIYSALFHDHFDGQLEGIERAIDADMYSSHLAALRDLQALSDHQVLPSQLADTVARSIVDVLPLLSTAEKRQHGEDLRVFVEARLDYRFAPPGTYRDERIDDLDSELRAGAAVYRRLSFGDDLGAVSLAEEVFPDGASNPFALLAYGDALAATGSHQQLSLVADTFPSTTASEAFIGAKMHHRLEDKPTAIEQLDHILTRQNPDHVGAQLMRAELDAQATIDALQGLTDPNHRHASSVERARAHLAIANIYERDEDQASRKRHLEEAIIIAPLHPDIAAPLIELLLENGAILEARTHLSRTPSPETRHPYFDIALARVHLIVGDIERADRRLERHALSHPEATATLGVIRARLGKIDEATALFDAVADLDEHLGATGFAWLYAKAGRYRAARELLEVLDDQSLSTFFVALKAEAFRLTANLASNRSDREEYSAAASMTLEKASHAPETRRQACLIALDERSQSRADDRCAELTSRDVASRTALDAAIRWYVYGDELAQARRFLADNIERAGPDPSVDLIYAELQLLEGNHDRARELVDELPSRIHDAPDVLVTEARLALDAGRLDRAQRYFSRAQETTPFHHPRAQVGQVMTALLMRESLFSTDGDADELDPDEHLEQSVRAVLRDGEIGPEAWASFAALRRHQERSGDAIENIGFAHSARNGYGSQDERRRLLTEEIAIRADRHGPGHRRVRSLLDDAHQLDTDSWRYHLLAARWHRHQSAPDASSVANHLRWARDRAPQICAIWRELDDAADDNLVPRRLITGSGRPDECN